MFEAEEVQSWGNDAGRGMHEAKQSETECGEMYV